MAGTVPARSRQYFTDSAGRPLAGGSVEVFYAGTDDLIDTYQDSLLEAKNENPVPLNARGECLMFLTGLSAVKFVVRDKDGVTVYTEDPVLVGGDRPLTPTFAVDRFSGDAAQTAFTLSTAPSSKNNTMVYVAGAYVSKDAYEVVDQILTFDTAPAAGTNNIEVQTIQLVEFSASANLIALQAQTAADAADAAATSEGNAGDSATAAAASAGAASTSEVNAAASAALAQSGGVAVPYATVAAGVAATSAGQIFDVAPVVGLFHYRYLRSGASDATFVGMVALTPAAQTVRDALLASKSPYLVPPLPATVTHLWDTSTAKKWDQRLIENVVSNVAPTLNLVPDPFNPLDEQGDATPTRSANDATVTDPLGNHNAIVLGYTAQLQSFGYFIRANSPNLPSDDYRQSVYLMQADATTGTMRIGAFNTVGEYTTLAVSGTWTAVARTSTGYSPAAAFDLGLTTHTGTTTFNVAAYNLQMYDSRAGTILPTNAQELAASQAGHLKAPSAFTGAVPLDSFGWVKDASGFDNLYADFMGTSVSELSFGCVIDVQTNPATTNAIVMTVGPHLATGITGVTRGQIGITKDTYRMYANPALAALVARSTDVLLNQGPVHIAITMKASQITPYINGVPQVMDTTSSTAIAWAAFDLYRIAIGAYDNLKKRRQANNIFADPMAYHWVAKGKCLTDGEMAATHRHIAARARMAGKPLGAHKLCLIGCGDSLTAFSESPFWPMNTSALLKPGVHTVLDANGGSRYITGATNSDNAYNAPARQAFRRRMMVAGLAAGYDEVIVPWQYGTNDVASPGVMDAPNTWQQGRDIIDAMIMADKAACDDGTGRLKTAIVTIPPNASASADRQTRMDEYNAATLTDYAARGYDYMLPLHQWVPAGFASFYAASLDAFTTGLDNSVFLGGGVHYSATGGQSAATDVFVPFYKAIADGLVGAV